jgi:hypothetical protein
MKITKKEMEGAKKGTRSRFRYQDRNQRQNTSLKEVGREKLVGETKKKVGSTHI